MAKFGKRFSNIINCIMEDMSINRKSRFSILKRKARRRGIQLKKDEDDEKIEYTMTFGK